MGRSGGHMILIFGGPGLTAYGFVISSLPTVVATIHVIHACA